MRNFEKIIYKYLDNKATSNELEQLEDWLKSKDNYEEFIKIVKLHYAINHSTKKFDASKVKKTLFEHINIDRKKTRINRIKSSLKYAAVFVGIVSVIGLIYKNPKELIIPPNSLTLELSDGTIKVIDEGMNSKIIDSKGNTIAQQDLMMIEYSKTVTSSKLKYNLLKVPYGKQFKVVLSDGTSVNLNSGSTLKYPIQFPENGNREIFLTGEAFFDVSKDKEHPFIVNVNDLNVKVYGTQFDVQAYEEDTTLEVILVEGSVGLYADNQIEESVVKLVPGEKGSYDKIKKNIVLSNVKTNIYTSWMKNELVFRNTSFAKMIKTMERHYNITIKNNNDSLSDIKFNANYQQLPIEKIFENLYQHYKIEYQITNDTIFIN